MKISIIKCDSCKETKIYPFISDAKHKRCLIDEEKWMPKQGKFLCPKCYSVKK